MKNSAMHLTFIYSDEATIAAQKEMTGLFLSCFDEIEKEFMLEYLSLVKVLPFIGQDHNGFKRTKH